MKKIELNFVVNKVKQGDIISANYTINGLNSDGLKGLEGQTFKDTLYLHRFSEQDVQVVFLKVPESSSLTDSDTNITWNPIIVEATQASEKLIFGNFEVPFSTHYVLWGAGASIFILVAYLIAKKVGKSNKAKREYKERLKKSKDTILNCNDYDDVVLVWKNKADYFELFPHLKAPYEKFEYVLNKYQFKQVQSQTEILEVMQAWREFKKDVEGGFSGI